MVAKQSLQKNDKSSPLFDEWRESKHKKLSIFFFFSFLIFSFSHFPKFSYFTSLQFYAKKIRQSRWLVVQWLQI